MIHVSDEEFGQIVEGAVHDIPERYAIHLNNLAFRVDETPSQEQLERSGILHGEATLLGLYQGVPLPGRGNGYNGMVPDIITIFQRPHELMATNSEELKKNVHQTVWHEVAHYFGLDHGMIGKLEK
jgi:predicted Zn-dependent protease with MMP-like domain